MISINSICPVCGKPSRSYMGNARKDKLCGKHADMLKAGEISPDGKGGFIDKTGKSLCITSQTDLPVEKPTIKAEEGVCKCISCGKETKPGFLFCVSCFHRYKDKRLLIRIDKCSEITLLDESYEGDLKCKDGHIVKSEKERFIDDYLFDHAIAHSYESTLPISLNKSIHPDFFLPKYHKPNTNECDDVYLEYFGFGDDHASYTEQKKFKLEQYAKMKLTVICISKDETNDFNGTLDKKLAYFKWHEITQ